MQTTLETIAPVIIPNFLGRTAGKEFEELCIYRMQCEEAAGRATMSRYGVQGNYTYAGNGRNGTPNYADVALTVGVDTEKVKNIFQYFGPEKQNQMIWQPMQSLPDFEGILMGGLQFCFDAKVCSQASFPLGESTMKERQLKHLKKRAKFGGVCFFLIHFNERKLATKHSPARTIAFPVRPDHPFWEMHERGEVKRISEQDAELYGFNVEWNVASGKRKSSPDILAAIKQMQG